jgi:hypothetical protein
MNQQQINMTTKQKPTSKVIQISETVFQNNVWLTALCEDGSIWSYEEGSSKWHNVLEAHEELIIDDSSAVREALKVIKLDLKEWEDDCLIFSREDKKPLNRDGVLSTFKNVQNLIDALENKQK